MLDLKSDTGWVSQNQGRCYVVRQRTVTVDGNQEEIQTFVDSIRKEMYGQQQLYKVNGNQLVFRDCIDSGD